MGLICMSLIQIAFSLMQIYQHKDPLPLVVTHTVYLTGKVECRMHLADSGDSASRTACQEPVG